MVDLNKSPLEQTIISFDTETTGPYPLQSEICEIAAVKWRNGQIVDTFQSLIKPSEPMSDFIIGIHGITNEMVANAPKDHEVMPKFREFIQDAILVAHHAPFDLGFISESFERNRISSPSDPVLCSSLLSRKIFPHTTNHKLQTLIKELNIPQGQAHRALDDSKACLDLTIKCINKFGSDKSLADLIKEQDKELEWKYYSINFLREQPQWSAIIAAIEDQIDVEITYSAGSLPNQPRPIRPIGVVRNPDADYVMAYGGEDSKPKRFYLNKITSSSF